ncbi:MAG: hypothetical protein RR232_08350 [Clostridia bacterium]
MSCCTVKLMHTRKKRHISAWIITLMILTVLALSLAALVPCYRAASEKLAALRAELNFYSAIAADAKDYILSTQLSNGALAFTPKMDGEARIVPYFSDTAAIALLSGADGADNSTIVRDYMDWHIAHQNDAITDVQGVCGSIYNYGVTVDNGTVIEETTDQTYDSIDSYAACFLILLDEYYAKTNDAAYFICNADGIFDVMDALLAMIADNGLSIVKPSNHTQYTMDNTEVFCALEGCARLLSQAYESQPAVQNRLALVNAALERQRTQFEALLWNPAEQRYEIGLNGDGEPLGWKGWHEFYPDATAQLFPIAYGVIPADSERAKQLYSTFCAAYDWQDMAHFTDGHASFYWGVLAYTGALMQDTPRVRAYMEYYQHEIMCDHKYPLYNADSGWIVLACNLMAAQCRQQMQDIDLFGVVSFIDSIAKPIPC